MNRGPDFIGTTYEDRKVPLTYGQPTMGYQFKRITGYHAPVNANQEGWVQALRTRCGPGVTIEWLP